MNNEFRAREAGNRSMDEATELTEAEKVAKIARFGFDKPERRTKRRYAHDLYPHAADGEIRPLSVEVPYLYSRAIGLEVGGTGWFGLHGHENGDRITQLINAREIAFLADAMLQGLTGDEAWTWASERADDESGEWVGERAEHYGVDWNAIKPYPCGPEPDHHDHFDAPDARGWRTVHRIPGKESECDECTEAIGAGE